MPWSFYWVTKAFLIATVFGLGTAWLGMGVGPGAVITAGHTVILTVYYWTFSPVGLPQDPRWLDLEHTWVTGVPVHFGVIYLGYLLALWLWRRRDRVRAAPPVPQATLALESLVVGGVIVVVAGGLTSLALGLFPGFTWFLVRALITVPFLLVWAAAAGRDRTAAVVGGVVLAFVWATYAHFLGPVGLRTSRSGSSTPRDLRRRWRGSGTGSCGSSASRSTPSSWWWSWWPRRCGPSSAGSPGRWPPSGLPSPCCSPRGCRPSRRASRRGRPSRSPPPARSMSTWATRSGMTSSAGPARSRSRPPTRESGRLRSRRTTAW